MKNTFSNHAFEMQASLVFLSTAVVENSFLGWFMFACSVGLLGYIWVLTEHVETGLQLIDELLKQTPTNNTSK